MTEQFGPALKMTAKPAQSHAHGDSSHERERRPLLSARSSSDGSDAATLPPDSEPEPAQKWTRRSILIVVMCFVVVTFFPCTDAVLDVGLLEILEGILCRKRHGSMPDPTTDPRCKDSGVQGEMANLLAISFTLGVLPGLTAVTWGVVAEKYGRKPVMLLSVSAIFLNNVMNLGICKSLYLFCLAIYSHLPATISVSRLTPRDRLVFRLHLSLLDVADGLY